MTTHHAHRVVARHSAGVRSGDPSYGTSRCHNKKAGHRPSHSPRQGTSGMTDIKATNITRHEGHVTREARATLLAQKGCTLWFTGLSGSGKSTIAFTLEHALVQRGRLAYVLDGDNIRFGLNKNLSFSAA